MRDAFGGNGRLRLAVALTLTVVGGAAFLAVSCGRSGAGAPPPVGPPGRPARLEVLSPPEGAVLSVPFLVQAIVTSPGAQQAPLGRVEVWIAEGERERRLGEATPGSFDPVTFRQFFDFEVQDLDDGQYELVVYAIPAGDREALEPVRRPIEVDASDDVRVFVDAPKEGETIRMPFLLEGWALDLRAERGTGVERVEVWDGPRESGTLLGRATYGFYRPDLGKAVGATRFNSAGFNLMLGDLASGPHALHVYALTRREGWSDPVVVNVVVSDLPRGPDNPAIEVAWDGLAFPSGLALAPDGRIFFTELQTGNIRVIEADGTLREQPFAHLDVATKGEVGLLSVALAPDFSESGFVYVVRSVPDADGRAVKHQVVRFRDAGGVGIDETVVVDNLPASSTGLHNGGAIAFGPDGMLYVSTGDNEQPLSVGDIASLRGKILRFTPEGGIPEDNPSPGSPVYAMGFRNVFGMAFQPFTGRLWATENGPDRNDEINVVVAGGHYGWPEVRGAAARPPFVDPALDISPSVGVTGIVFLDAATAYFCDVVTQTLHRLDLAGPTLDQVGAHELEGRGCGLSIVAAPGGVLYFSDDHAIYRYRPSPP
ncbi:MAG TPA: PQQ-dependent sugar dehydrogenase [Dehalococcoidia bacterium]|nr:PQQ-dependent sugar dehydrogenase [Dehalococcoidia bacterium]